MSRDDKVLLKLTYPRWFQVIVPPLLLLYLFFLVLVGFYLSLGDLTSLKVGIAAFFLAIFLIWLWIFPLIYSSVIATESGLRATGIFRRRRRLTWDEIVRVSRPFLGIPREIIYVFSKSGEKIILLRGMEGYADLLKLIESKASNLSSKKLPQNVWPRKLPWRTVWLVMAGIVAVYIGLRLLFK